MGDCFGFVSECGMGLECDDVGRVLGQDWYEIGGVRVLLQIRFQSWSLNHHSQRVSWVENRRGEVVDVDVWGGLFSDQTCNVDWVVQVFGCCFEKLMEYLGRHTIQDVGAILLIDVRI